MEPGKWRNSLISRRGSEWNRRFQTQPFQGWSVTNSPVRRPSSLHPELPPNPESFRALNRPAGSRRCSCPNHSLWKAPLFDPGQTDHGDRFISPNPFVQDLFEDLSDAYQLSLGLGWEYKGIEWKVWILSTPAIFNCLCQLIAHEQSGLSQSHSSAIENQSPPKTGSPFHGLMSLISAWRVQSRSRLTLRKSAAIPDPSCTRSTV